MLVVVIAQVLLPSLEQFLQAELASPIGTDTGSLQVLQDRVLADAEPFADGLDALAGSVRRGGLCDLRLGESDLALEVGRSCHRGFRRAFFQRDPQGLPYLVLDRKHLRDESGEVDCLELDRFESCTVVPTQVEGSPTGAAAVGRR